jgi:ATP-dependent DNA helicase RecG
VDVFHRAGLIKKWDRGTNRVIEMCKKHGAPPPTFEEMQGFLIVTFKAQMVAGRMARVGSQVESKVESQPELRPESQPESQPESLDRRVLALLKTQALSKAEISTHLGQKEVSGQLNKVIRSLIAQGLIEYTLPDKPNSRLQKYRLPLAGERALKELFGEEER